MPLRNLPIQGGNLNTWGTDLNNDILAGSQAWSALRNGVIGDGITDDTANIVAFLAACNAAGATAYFPARDYVCGAFYLNIPPRITGEPGARILCNQLNDSWNFGNTSVTGTSQALTGTTAEGGQVVFCTSTTGINVDDVVLIGDTATMVGNSGSGTTLTIPAANLYRVYSVDSPTQLTIADPMMYQMTVANGGYLATLDMKRWCWVKGLHFENIAGQGVTSTNSALRFWNCRDLDVDITMRGMSSAGLLIDQCYMYRVRARAENFADIAQTGFAGQIGYGVNVGYASAHGMIDLFADKTRHAFSGGGTGHDLTVTGTAIGCTGGGTWDCHPGMRDVFFKDCVARHCTGNGFYLRGRDYYVIGGMVDQCAGGGVELFNAPKDCVIRGLTVKRVTVSDEQCVWVADNADGVTVQGCNFDGCTGPAVSFNGGGSYANIRIQGNSIRNMTGAAVNLSYGGAATTYNYVRIVDNIVEDNQGSPTCTAVVNAPTGTYNDVTVQGNHACNSIPISIGAGAGGLNTGTFSSGNWTS